MKMCESCGLGLCAYCTGIECECGKDGIEGMIHSKIIHSKIKRETKNG